MIAKDMFVCPNCGAPIEIQSIQKALTCQQCREVLIVVAGNRVVLANPLRTYLRADAAKTAPFSVALRPPLSAQRKKRMAQLTYERVTSEEQLDSSGLIYGTLAIVFGAFLSLLSWLRLEQLQDDWLGRLGLGLGAGVVAIGVLAALWFWRSIRSARAIKRQAEREMNA